MDRVVWLLGSLSLQVGAHIFYVNVSLIHSTSWNSYKRCRHTSLSSRRMHMRFHWQFPSEFLEIKLSSEGSVTLEKASHQCEPERIRIFSAWHDLGCSLLIQPYWSRLGLEAIRVQLYVISERSHCMGRPWKGIALGTKQQEVCSKWSSHEPLQNFWPCPANLFSE